MKKILAVFAVLVGLSAGDCARAQSEISVDVSVDAISGYIWRGGILGSDEALVLQPSLTLGFGESGVAFNVWGSAFGMDRSAPESTDQVDELDFTLSYDTSLGEDGKVGLSLGFIEYTFPSLDAGTKHSEEAYGSLSFDNTIAPSITVYYDFGLIDDYYVTAGIGPEFPLGDADNAPVLGLSASVGFSGGGYDFSGGDSAGFNDVSVGASVGFTAGEISISPYIGATFTDEKVGNTDDRAFWGGISIGFSK